MAMAKVVVLGGAGFLGANVGAALKPRGCDVESASRRTGVDAREEPVLLAYLERVKPEILIHCAAHVGGIAYNARCPTSELLERMQRFVGPRCWRLLGVTGLDLYIPILTFVFGEAQLGGPCAVVSAHRLRQEFYGLPPNKELLRQRLRKEAVHELGHTFDLTHCDDYRCAMAPSHAVEWIDLKESTLCATCQVRASDSCCEQLMPPSKHRSL